MEHVCELGGTFFEVLGAVLLANRYLRSAYVIHIPIALFSSIWNGRYARGMAKFGDLTREDALSSLRGLTALIIGFSIRSVPHIIYFCELRK